MPSAPHRSNHKNKQLLFTQVAPQSESCEALLVHGSSHLRSQLFAHHLNEWREANDMTISGFASWAIAALKEAGDRELRRQAVENWLRGKNLPTRRRALTLEQAMGVDYGTLTWVIDAWDDEVVEQAHRLGIYTESQPQPPRLPAATDAQPHGMRLLLEEILHELRDQRRLLQDLKHEVRESRRGRGE